MEHVLPDERTAHEPRNADERDPAIRDARVINDRREMPGDILLEQAALQSVPQRHIGQGETFGDGVDFFGFESQGEERSNDGTHAAPGDAIRAQPFLFQHFQHADIGDAERHSAGENESPLHRTDITTPPSENEHGVPKGKKSVPFIEGMLIQREDVLSARKRRDEH